MEEKNKLSLERMTTLAAFAGWAALPCDDGCVVFSSQYFRAKVDPGCVIEDLEYWMEVVVNMKEEAEREYGREERKYEIMLETEDALRALMEIFLRDAKMDAEERRAVTVLERCGFDAAFVQNTLHIKYCSEEAFAEFKIEVPENIKDKKEFLRDEFSYIAEDQEAETEEYAADICAGMRAAAMVM